MNDQHKNAHCIPFDCTLHWQQISMSNTESLYIPTFADFNSNVLVPCLPKTFTDITLWTLSHVWYFLLNPHPPLPCVCVIAGQQTDPLLPPCFNINSSFLGLFLCCVILQLCLTLLQVYSFFKVPHFLLSCHEEWTILQKKFNQKQVWKS